MPQRLERIKEDTVEHLANIVKTIKAAVENHKLKMPEIYLLTPHFDYHKMGEKHEYDAYAKKYADFVSDIYDRVLKKGVKEEDITGLNFGKEDPFDMEDADAVVVYKCVQEISKFIHSRPGPNGTKKKLLWKPYTNGNKDNMEHIGKLVNIGTYAADNKTYDLFDTVIIQPSVYFTEFVKNDVPYLPNTSHDIYQSTLEQKAQFKRKETDQSFEIIGEGKLTDTVIGFQMEYDMGLVTGRPAVGSSTNYILLPKQKVAKFNSTLALYKDLIYGTTANQKKFSYGIYPGGPNEQAYTTDIGVNGGNNTNRHSLINYQTAFARREFVYEKNDWFFRDSGFYSAVDGVEFYGDKKPYSEFYNAVSYINGRININNNLVANIGTKDTTRNFYAQYNGSLIYDITKGLLHNIWSDGTQNFLQLSSSFQLDTIAGSTNKKIR